MFPCTLGTYRADSMYLALLGYKGASDMYIDTNVQLAIAAARQVICRGACHLLQKDGMLPVPMPNTLLTSALLPQIRKAGKTVHIVVPDATEFKRSYKL